VHFLEPSTGPGTANEGETATAIVDEPLQVFLHSGSILTVEITASTQKLAVNKPVRFTANVTGAPPGTTLTYTWIFGDGTGSSQTLISHSYSVAGTYDVYLEVTGSGDSMGSSPEIPITVGKAAPGPDRQGGGKVKKKKEPTSGASRKGSSTRKSTGKKGASSTTKAGTTNSAAKTGATPATSSTTTAATATPKAPVKPAASHNVSVKRATRPAAPLLSGIAVSGARVPAARAARPAASARPGVPNPARTGRLTPPGHGVGEWFWIALCTVATLIAGALLECKGWPLGRLPVRIRALRFQ
jgi:hypothetical protein